MLEHRPVLLHETLDALAVNPEGTYVDATYGRGGHAAAIVQRLGKSGRLMVLDRDPEAVAAAQAAHGSDSRVTVVAGAFANLGAVLAGAGWQGQVDGLLLDIGVSSPQLDDPARGFSFRTDGPLDMRMDPAASESAADFIARAEAGELYRIFRLYGEERHAKRIVAAILEARAAGPIETTTQLAEIIAAVVTRREPGRHPATRVFQALRIHVNDELGQLDRALEASLDALAPGGRLCVISFHSLEDRRVKRFMRQHAQPDPMWRGMPDIPAEAQAFFRRPARAIKPGAEETAANPRARSAVLRVAERRS